MEIEMHGQLPTKITHFLGYDLEWSDPKTRFELFDTDGKTKVYTLVSWHGDHREPVGHVRRLEYYFKDREQPIAFDFIVDPTTVENAAKELRSQGVDVGKMRNIEIIYAAADSRFEERHGSFFRFKSALFAKDYALTAEQVEEILLTAARLYIFASSHLATDGRRRNRFVSDIFKQLRLTTFEYISPRDSSTLIQVNNHELAK